MPSTLFSFIVFVLYMSCEKNENKQIEAGFGPFLERTSGEFRQTLKYEQFSAHSDPSGIAEPLCVPDPFSSSSSFINNILLFLLSHVPSRFITSVKLTHSSVTRWLDYVSLLAIYNNKNLPNSIFFCQNWF